MNKINRRKFMTTAGAATLGTATLSQAQFHSKDDQSGNIDAHVHVWDANRDKYPLSPDFAAKEVNPPVFSPDVLMAEQKGTGVTRTVLIQMSFFKYDNSYMSDVIAADPKRFRGVAIVDESKDDLKKTMVDLKGKGTRGFRLYAFLKNVETWGKSEGIKKMWKIGAEENLSMCCLTDPESLLYIETLCKENPETPVVIDHFARIGMTGSVDRKQLDSLLALAKYPKTYVKTSAFYALGAKSPPYTELGPMIKELRDTFGSERLMWGSDCPYQVQGDHSYAASVALIEEKLDFLSEVDKTNIMRKTAEKVFFS